MMTSMLDTLKGYEDTLREIWIGDPEEIENGVAIWGMDAAKVGLEGRLGEIIHVQEEHMAREARGYT
jgi:hypothetical protein